MVKAGRIEDYDDRIGIYTIENDRIKLVVTNLGCRILELFVPDKMCNMKDIVLGLKDLSDHVDDPAYFGAVVGRVCNRIKKGTFSLNGVTYKLATNNGANHLHGGISGFDKKIFDTTVTGDGLEFYYLSKDGEEGYPGNLKFKVRYILKDNTFTIQYKAESDKDTIINFTNHTYFNLSDTKENVLDHYLQMSADRVGLIDDACMATGEIIGVEGTVFDFRQGKKIGDAVLADDPQIRNAGGGVDHPFLFEEGDGNSPRVILWDETSARKVMIETTMPGVQIYTGNFLAEGRPGKTGTPYANHAGVAIETQNMPNSINSPDPECVILRKGETYRSQTKYTFTVI